jgi:hypothetical protein
MLPPAHRPALPDRAQERSGGVMTAHESLGLVTIVALTTPETLVYVAFMFAQRSTTGIESSRISGRASPFAVVALRLGLVLATPARCGQ